MSKGGTKIHFLGLTSNDVDEDEKAIGKRDAADFSPERANGKKDATDFSPERANGKKDAADFSPERVNGKRAAPDYRPATIEEIKSICCKDGCEIRDLVAYCNPW